MLINHTTHDSTEEGAALSPSTAVVILSVAFEVILIPLILLGNGAVVLLVARTESLQTTTNAFMVSLAAADTLQGLSLVLVIMATISPESINGRYACLSLWCFLMLASGCSSLSLLLVTMDRYVKIMHPLTYHLIVSRTRVAMVIVTAWLYTATMMLVLPMSGLNEIPGESDDFSCLDFTGVFNPIHLQIVLFTNGIGPFTIMCLVYIRVFTLVLSKLRTSDGANPANTGRSRFFRRELRSVKTFLVLLGLTGLAWLPVSTVVLIEIHSGYRASIGLRSIISLLTFMNSAANPIVYSLRSEAFQQATRLSRVFRGRLCFCFMRTKRVGPKSIIVSFHRKTVMKNANSLAEP